MHYLLTLTLPYGMTGKADSLMNTMGRLGADVYSTLTVFVYVLAFAGLLLAATSMMMGGDLAGTANQLVMIVVVAGCLQAVPSWVLDAETVCGFTMLDKMNIDIGQIAEDYVDDVGSWIVEEAATALVDLALGFFILDLVILAMFAIVFIIVAAVIAAIIYVAVLAAYVVQAMGIQIAIAITPLFLGMLLFPTTKQTGVTYLTGIVGVLFWPLGWGLGFRAIHDLADLVDDACNSCPAVGAVDVIFAGVISFARFVIEGMLYWTVLTKAPGLVNAAITTGSQLGTGLVSAGV